jgi:hypothetical protein
LAVFEQLASEWQHPTIRLLDASKQMAAEVGTVDVGVMSILDWVRAFPESLDEDGKDALRAIAQVDLAAAEAFPSFDSLREVLEKTSGASRALRGPVRRIDAALRTVTDTAPYYRRWREEIEALLGAPLAD